MNNNSYVALHNKSVIARSGRRSNLGFIYEKYEIASPERFRDRNDM